MEKDKFKDKDSRKGIFQPPPVAEWNSYCQSLSPPMPEIAAQPAFDYYVSNGWKVGKNPMKDWKAAARNCHTRWVGGPNGGAPPPKPIRYNSAGMPE